MKLYIIYCSTFHLKNMKKAKHFYINGTFLCPSKFTQIIIVLYIHTIIIQLIGISK